MSNSKAQAAKEKGNTAFKAGDYPTAIGHYTSAILADRADTTYPLNRAAAYLKLGKFEDAERDCTTVLGLTPKNVKALFRRGQARVGMARLLEAQKDFSDALLVEPTNTAAGDELRKVTTHIQQERAKKAKSPQSAVQASSEPSVTPQRRRVPIRIIDPSNSSSQLESTPDSTLPKPSTAQILETKPVQPTKPTSSMPETSQAVKTPKAPSTAPKPDTLEAVSSRSLKASPPPTTEPVPPSLAAAAASLQPDSSSAKEPSAPKSSFKDAKQARESAKPSRVGGGIFRSSGQNTIFPTRVDTGKSTDSPKPEPKTQTASLQMNSEPKPIPAKPSKTAAPIHKAPATLFDFNRTWSSVNYPEEKWQFINTIPPAQFPAFCKNSLEPALLSSILEVFVDVLSTESGDGRIKTTILDYMNNFPKIARFSTVILFFSRSEKAVAKRVWELLAVDIPAGVWRAVA